MSLDYEVVKIILVLLLLIIVVGTFLVLVLEGKI